MNIKTKILHANSNQDILRAASMIQQGKIVAVPTETVYGLAADAKNVQAVKQIFVIKNRPADHPLIVHIGSVEELSQWAQEIPTIATTLAKHFWPGPLTLLLKKHSQVDDVVTGGLQTIALRIPDNKALLTILHTLRTGLAAPSANPHKRISPTTADHVLTGLSGKIDAVLDDGPCTIGVESTILDITQRIPTILRHGPITKQMIEDIIKIDVHCPAMHSEHVSGNMKVHYQPYTRTSMMSLQEIETQLDLVSNQKNRYGIIHYSLLQSAYNNVHLIKLSQNKAEYTKRIYQALHELDTLGVDQIFIETPPNQDSWNDILDRLSKACATDK